VTRRLAAIRVSDVRRREVVMLRPNLRIPLGALTVVCGQQGIGKGTIVCLLAAEQSVDHGVIFLAEEDSAEAVLKPRLEAAGADLSRVHIVRGERFEGGVLLPNDTEELAAIAYETQTRLLVIDPWTNHVDALNIDKGHVRAALMPLARIAEECKLAGVLVAHPVKGAGAGDPLSEIAHASAVSQVARAAFWVTHDPECESGSHRLLSQVKANLSPFGPTLRFELAETYLPANGVEPAMTTVRAIARGESDLDYRRIRKLERDDAPDQSKLGEARAWLRHYLTEHGETPKPAVISAAGSAGHSARTIERAREAVADWRADPPGPNLSRLRSGAPSVAPVGAAGAPGVPVEVSLEEGVPAHATAGTPGASRTVTGEEWRTLADLLNERTANHQMSMDDAQERWRHAELLGPEEFALFVADLKDGPG
jgi:putative DNA primase/helicase